MAILAKWQKKHWQCFVVIYSEDDIISILVKFESDRLRNPESAQKWTNGRPWGKLKNYFKI